MSIKLFRQIDVLRAWSLAVVASASARRYRPTRPPRCVAHRSERRESTQPGTEILRALATLHPQRRRRGDLSPAAARRPRRRRSRHRTPIN